MIGGLKSASDLRWANPLELKNTVEKVFVDTFGSKEGALVKLKAEKVKVKKQIIVIRNFTFILAAEREAANDEGVYL